MANKSIIPGTATRNQNRIKKLKQKLKSQIKNESLNRKGIRKENKIKPKKIQKKR